MITDRVDLRVWVFGYRGIGCYCSRSNTFVCGLVLLEADFTVLAGLLEYAKQEFALVETSRITVFETHGNCAVKS